MRKKHKEDGTMATAITMTPVTKTEMANPRKTLSDIREKALKRRKEYSSVVYEAKEENQFFETMESQIYKQIVSDDE